MTATKPTSIEVAQAFYDAFGKADMDAINDLLTDDVEFHEPGQSPVSGDYSGRADVMAFFGRLGASSAGTLEVEVHDLMGSEKYAVALFQCRSRREGDLIIGDVAEVFTIRDGKISDIRAHVYDPTEWDKAYG